MADKIAKVICPHCNETIVALRGIKGRIIITTSTGASLGVVGGIIGAAIGLASGGGGMPATIPLAIIGTVVGSGLGYVVSDKTTDKPRCPKCGKTINLGIK